MITLDAGVRRHDDIQTMSDISLILFAGRN